MAEEIKEERKDKQEKKPQSGRRERPAKKVEDDGFDKRLVKVRRVTKVIKGGRTMRFSALVVVGDGKGKVGYGIGKAAEVPIAIDKATVVGKKSLRTIALVDGTIPHQTVGKYGSTSIMMIPAPEGTGVIAGGAARAVLEVTGVKNIVTKIHGSTNAINVVKATINGLTSLRTKEEIAARRGKKVEEI